MYNVGLNTGYNNVYFKSDKGPLLNHPRKLPSVEDLPGNQPLAGLVTPPKRPKKSPKGRPPVMAGAISVPGLDDRPGYKPDGTSIDPEKAKEAIDKILGKNYDEVA